MTDPTPRSQSPLRRLPRWRIGIGLVLVAGLAGGWLWARHHHDTVRAWLRALKGGETVHAVEGGPEISSPDYARLGEGFLVWESNRTGPWRIWTRRLDGSGLRQLTPEASVAKGSEQCCATLSPDGKQVAYLSLSGTHYGADDEEGELHLVGADGKGDRIAAPRAQTASRGHRATVWHDATRLEYIDGDGNALLLDLGTGKYQKLAGPSAEGPGWLIDPTRRFATTGLPTFSVYDRSRSAVTERSAFGGCEPTFSEDGHWGVWMFGAGGPIGAIDLETRAAKTLLEKNDPRLGTQAYLYFPKLSNGSALLAFGASPNEHDHEKGNYDVFVVEVDPRTLDVIGTPLQYTSAHTPDRYPDVYVEPLPLGRTFGEAPYRALLQPYEGEEAQNLPAETVWNYGDGSPTTTGKRGEHTYEKPGSYALKAQAPGSPAPLFGRVTILPAQPPKALGAELRRGREIVVRFDEPIALLAASFKATLASGRKIANPHVADDGRSLSLQLAEVLTAGDHLHLAGVVDQAQRPNPLPPGDIEVPPPSWPAQPRSLILAWATADQPNLAPDPSQAAERTYAFAPHGKARLDHDQAMLLVGDGAFRAEDEAGKSLVELAKKSNELTLELNLTPAETGPASGGTIVSFTGTSKGGEPLFELAQQGDALLWRLWRGKAKEAPLRFGKLQAGHALHAVLSYSPGRTVIHLDGVKALESATWQGDFFDWQPGTLTVGAGNDEQQGWKGGVEGLALYDRLLGSDEAAEDFRRWSAVRARRPQVVQAQILGTLERCSRVPSLDEISPYRQALAACLYHVDKVVAGSLAGSSVKVARWVILDGATLPAPARGSVPLTLEPFAANPQLESLYLSNELGGTSGGASPLYFDPFSR